MARGRGGPQGRSLCNPLLRIVSLSRSRQRVRDRIRIRYRISIRIRIRIRIYSVCLVLLRTFFVLLPFA